MSSETTIGIPKFCVFCGGPPATKTKEHIVPLWLIKLTGNPNRTVYLGRNWLSPTLEKRIYSWDAFTFPACDACNREWSKLEAAVQQVMLRMLEGGLVSAGEIHILLDWLDKVRTGIWLGMLYLNRNYRALIPSFHIASRVCSKDRAVLIYESTERDDGIGLSAIDTPIFHYMPSAFELTINQLHFISISYDFLFGGRFGWPHVSSKRLIDIDTDGFQGDFEKGTERIAPPILDNLPPFSGTAIFQPVGHQEHFRRDPKDFAKEFGTPYVASMSRNPNQAIGHIYCGNDAPKPYPESASDLWEPRSNYPKSLLMNGTGLWIGRLQKQLYLASGDYSHFPIGDKHARDKEMESTLKLQDRILEHLEDGGF